MNVKPHPGFMHHFCRSKTFLPLAFPSGKENGNIVPVEAFVNVPDHSHLYILGPTFTLLLFFKKNNSMSVGARFFQVPNPLLTCHVSLNAHVPLEVSLSKFQFPHL